MSEPLLKHSRLPRKYESKPPVEVEKRSVVESAGLKGVDPQALLKRYLSDESTDSIAKDYKVTRQALGGYLLRNAESEWKEAQVARAIARKEAAEDALEVAQDPLQLAKARELLKAAQWDLERTCRRIYGEDKSQVNVVTPILNITIQADGNSKGLEQPAFAPISYAHAQDGVAESPRQIVDTSRDDHNP